MNARIANAFELARPAASLPPTLGEGHGGGQHSTRPRRVNLAPRAGSLHITNAEQGRAAAPKTEQIKRGSIGAKAAPVLPSPPLGEGGVRARQRKQGQMADFDAPASVDRGRLATVTPARPENASGGPLSAPVDLLAFVRSRTIAEAARALGLARGSIYNLRAGYWPHDARRMLAAWGDYKASQVSPGERWALRTVQPGARVRYEHALHGAPELAGRAGQALALCRMSDGKLVAQTLALPAQRFVLTAVEPPHA